ncbi:VOC family protein [Dokdonella sp. MW10]|uniref:VOC family protein n=1 Tax=Dokdonella sp. MW10 TaxID=2992926 RepID=UPI003F819C68
MEPKITVITLGVDNLEAALRFYRDGLGFATEGIVGETIEHGAVVFIDLQPGLRWPCGRAPASRTTLGFRSAPRARPR